MRKYLGENDGAQMIGDADMDAAGFQTVDITDLCFKVFIDLQNLAGNLVVSFSSVG